VELVSHNLTRFYPALLPSDSSIPLNRPIFTGNSFALGTAEDRRNRMFLSAVFWVCRAEKYPIDSQKPFEVGESLWIRVTGVDKMSERCSGSSALTIPLCGVGWSIAAACQSALVQVPAPVMIKKSA